MDSLDFVMRNQMKQIALFLVLCASISGNALAEINTVTLDIPKMDCPLCPITIETAIKKVEGVSSVEADLDTKSATVSFDDSVTTVQAVIAATTDAGYPAEIKQ